MFDRIGQCHIVRLMPHRSSMIALEGKHGNSNAGAQNYTWAFATAILVCSAQCLSSTSKEKYCRLTFRSSA
jgi:hypothetical protein